MNLGGYVLLAILAVICLEETRGTTDVNALSCEAGRNLREDVTSLQDTVTDMQATVNNQSDVIASILAILEEKQAAGLDKIHRLTSSQNYTLRVDLEDWDGSTAYAEYRDFSISGPDDFYRLHVGGYYGTAGDSIHEKHFTYDQNNQQFSTLDQDHDSYIYRNCARDIFHGGWWFSGQCGYANLNGVYNGTGAKGIMC
nr:hypothetical protein BaRGS_017378 [Batillaria attramentaria]